MKLRSIAGGLLMRICKSNDNCIISIGYPKPNAPISPYSGMVLHNPNGPAFIWYKTIAPYQRYKSISNWYVNGVLHRDVDEPSTFQFESDGTIKYQTYYKHGAIHRDFGPAHYHYSADFCVYARYYQNHDQISETKLKPFLEIWNIDSLDELHTNKAAHMDFMMRFS